MKIKSQLIESVGRSLSSLTEKEIALGINHIIDQLATALLGKNRIEIRGFGAFTPRFRAPRLAHNPKTGEKVTTSPRYSVHFKPGKELREGVNAAIGQPIITDD